MRLFLICVSGLMLANVFLPTQCLRHSVNELQKSHDSFSLFENVEPTLNFKRRRDVSHLDLGYLPPAATKFKQTGKVYETSKKPPTPAFSKYLPPTSAAKDLQIATETLPPQATAAKIMQTEIETEPVQLANEYLPPATETAQQRQLPSNDYLPPIKTRDDFGLIPPAILKTNENNEIEELSEVLETTNETPQDTSVLDIHGYHYKIPDIMPNLLPSSKQMTEYLPPLEKSAIEGPANGESAALENDGYHYRAIKRLF